MRRTVAIGFLSWLTLGMALVFGRAVLWPLFSGDPVGLPVLLLASLVAIIAAGVLFFARRHFWNSSDTRRESAAPISVSPPRLLGGHMAVFLVLTLAIGLTGYSYNRYQAAQDLESVKNALSSVADLKAGQISNWYHDRLVNAQIILENRSIRNEAMQFLAEPAAAQRGQDLLEMVGAQDERRYRRIVLYDAQGAVRLSLPENAAAPDALRQADFQSALSGSEVVVTDLHRDSASGQDLGQDVHISFWIPMRDRSAGDGKAAGVLMLDVDPYELLYPLIQFWPTPSPTAETLLVRRDGNDVVYLNELRHRKNTALTLRFAMDQNKTLPAALAVQGKEGIVESSDYRKVPVLAVLRRISGTPWFMVSKIDLDEIRAPMRRQAVTTMIILVVLVLASALGVGLQARQRDGVWLRKQLAVEQERQAIAERYILLNKHANDIIILSDHNGNILEANDRALEAYGCSLEEMKTLTLKDLRGPESDAGFRDGSMMESVHRRRDGSCFLVESSTHATEVGGATYHQSVIRDITERKRVEQELRATRDYLEKLLNHANAPIIVWDPDLVITRFNHAFERLAGRSAEDMVGRHLSVLFPEESRETALSEIAHTLTGGHWESVEIPILRSDGTVRTALWNSANVYAADEKTLEATIAQGQDITERKRAEAELVRLNQELARKNQELEQIVYVASHDLRSPLVNVQGFSAELKAALEELTAVLNGLSLPPETRGRLNALLAEDVRESLGYIISGIAKMDTLISGLLRLSRLGRAALTIAPIDMNRLVADLTGIFEFQIKEAGVTLSIGELPPCLGDVTLLNHAFSNLLNNALKYLSTARAGMVSITGACENGQSVYCIEDNGIGIAEKHQTKIFDLYHRLNPNASTGEGLGLTIVRTVMDRQHGRVWLESEPGVGTRFYVALPGAGDTGKDIA